MKVKHKGHTQDPFITRANKKREKNWCESSQCEIHELTVFTYTIIRAKTRLGLSLLYVSQCLFKSKD